MFRFYGSKVISTVRNSSEKNHYIYDLGFCVYDGYHFEIAQAFQIDTHTYAIYVQNKIQFATSFYFSNKSAKLSYYLPFSFKRKKEEEEKKNSIATKRKETEHRKPCKEARSRTKKIKSNDSVYTNEWTEKNTYIPLYMDTFMSFLLFFSLCYLLFVILYVAGAPTITTTTNTKYKETNILKGTHSSRLNDREIFCFFGFSFIRLWVLYWMRMLRCQISIHFFFLPMFPKLLGEGKQLPYHSPLWTFRQFCVNKSKCIHTHSLYPSISRFVSFLTYSYISWKINGVSTCNAVEVDLYIFLVECCLFF